MFIALLDQDRMGIQMKYVYADEDRLIISAKEFTSLRVIIIMLLENKSDKAWTNSLSIVK